MIQLEYTINKGTPEEQTWWLDPDNPNHQRNMEEMTVLQRAILRAYMETVLKTIVRAQENADTGRTDGS